MLSDQELRDLGGLATQRAENAVNSVGQFLDNPEQAIELLVNVINAMAVNAAELIRENMEKPDGTRPGVGEAYARVLAMLASANGLETRMMSKEEATAHGLS